MKNSAKTICWLLAVAGCSPDADPPAREDAGGWMIQDASNVNSGDDASLDHGTTTDASPAKDFAGVVLNSCAQNSDCVLQINACCWPCGETSLADFDAINAERAADHTAVVCPIPEPCPRCASIPNSNLFATCNNGACEGFDVAASALSECELPSDCALRTNACCECSDVNDSTVIALRQDAMAEFAALRCDGSEACDLCLPTYDGFQANCVANRCVVEVVP